jgi:polyribonucleotide nucleotidyltransferase
VAALQLDLKVSGVDMEVLREVTERAREARMEILRAMLQTIRSPRESLSPYAPVLRRLQIDPENIGALIGPGGRTIKRLEEDFVCSIEVEDDGTVTVSGESDGDVAGAVTYIERLGGGVKEGELYEGRVTEIKDFGAIVELFPGADGLCHISELDTGYVDKVEDICKVGDTMQVKVLSVEGDRVRLSRKATLSKKEGAEKKSRR